MNNIPQNSLRAWISAARPKTLSGALVPVAVAVALFAREGVFDNSALWAALLCALFASVMQVASNFINDLLDFIRGNDREDRLGPERACQQGWISPPAMKRGILATLSFAALIGIFLLVIVLRHSPHSPWLVGGVLLGLGCLCMVGAFVYSTHLSAKGLGDVLVLLFFGLIPVGGTYFAITHRLTSSALILGLAVGFVVDTLLVVNNFRDRDTDRAVGKRTLIVVCGERWGGAFYLLFGFFGFGLTVFLDFLLHERLTPLTLFTLFYLPFHALAWWRLRRIWRGRELNGVLGITSRNILLFALFVVLGLLIGG